MQYKKQHIKDKILTAAIDEFEKRGYNHATIADIADNSNVTVGNIYRYFPSKKELFEACVQDAYKQIPVIIQDIYQHDKNKFNVKEFIKNIAAHIVNIYKVYSKQLLILAFKSQGTKYSNFLKEVSGLITKLIESELFDNPDKNDEFIAEIITSGFVNGLFTILKTNDSKNFQSLTERLLMLYFYNIEERL